jgi:uncharacterized protein YndB with AHSA1/START domain
MATEILKTTAENEIVSSRVFNFSKELLFKAWSEPEHLKNWWGPAGFTNTFHTFDFKVGGKWVFTMHGPEKGNYQNECEFIQIDEPNLIAWQRISQPIFQILATFEEIAPNQTKLVFKMLFDTVKEREKLNPYVVDKNEENFDKLEVELAKMNVNS